MLLLDLGWGHRGHRGLSPWGRKGPAGAPEGWAAAFSVLPSHPPPHLMPCCAHLPHLPAHNAPPGPPILSLVPNSCVAPSEPQTAKTPNS